MGRGKLNSFLVEGKKRKKKEGHLFCLVAQIKNISKVQTHKLKKTT